MAASQQNPIPNVFDFVVSYIDNWYWNPPHTPLSTWKAPLIGSITYVIGIVLLKRFMKDRKPYDIKAIQVIYNTLMVALSLTMFLGMLFAAWQRAKLSGPFSLICEGDEIFSGLFGFLIYIFYLSKYVELFDTVQMILKKKQVIPLHIFHHLIMISGPWGWLEGTWIIGSWWCVLVNSLIHTFMYYYYLISCLGYDVWWKKYLTQGQIVQFFSGFILVNYWFYIRKEYECKGWLLIACYSHLANFTFIFLFIKFFIDTYTARPRGKSDNETKLKTL